MYYYMLYIDITDSQEILGVFDKEHLGDAYLDAWANAFHNVDFWGIKVKQFKLNSITHVGTML